MPTVSKFNPPPKCCVPANAHLAGLASQSARLAARTMTKAEWKAYSQMQRMARRVEQAIPNSCAVNSFTPETLVLMADGSSTPIGEIKVGDWVIAKDPVTGEEGAREVTNVIVGEGIKHLIDVEIGNDGMGVGPKVTATDQHPFWVVNRGAWINAMDLVAGDLLQTDSGELVVVEGITAYTATFQTVRNLTVDGIHTYFVLVGQDPVLVHNCSYKYAYQTFLANAKLVGVAHSDAKWLWKSVISKTQDKTWMHSHYMGLLHSVAEMNKRDYRLIKVNVGYGDNLQHGIDLVFRHNKLKNYGFVESKGGFLAKHGPKIDYATGAMQGSRVWNIDRLERAFRLGTNKMYAKYLSSRLSTAEHFVYFQGVLKKQP